MDYNDRITEIEEWINSRMSEADKISDWKFRMLCYYSILDAFVQEYYDYSTQNNRGHFVDFILKYQNKYGFLEEVDPITLFYHYKGEIGNEKLLEFLEVDSEYLVSEVQNISSWFWVKSILDEHKKKKHTYIELLYQLRNKLVHEHTTPDGVMGSKIYCDDKFEPFYSSCGVTTKMSDGTWGFVDYWHLTFPPQFICDLTRNVISNYLEECRKLQCDPFKNNIKGRKMKLAWYD